jgi:hypothetical protein
MKTSQLEHLTTSNLENDFLDTEVSEKHLKHIGEQKEALAESLELRQAISDVLKIRHSLGDPSLATIDLDRTAEYEGFDGARLAMRRAFDFRTKSDGTFGERWEAEEQAEKYFLPAITPELEEKIYQTAKLFGLTGDSQPKDSEADAVLILGGGDKSPLDRTLYAKELIDTGKLKTNKIVALGSERVVSDAERKRAGEYAENAQTEFALMVAAIETAYGIEIDQEDTLEWTDHNIEYDIPKKHKVVCIPGEAAKYPDIFIVSSAIVTDPFVDATHTDGSPIKLLRNRANSADTFKTFKDLDDSRKVVAVTNAHFVPFQGAAAAKELGKQGVDVEVVGFDPQYFGNSPKKAFELVQEMLATADSLAAASE